MSDKIHQIYHVARCGSTLLTAILSSSCAAYSEPNWSKRFLIGLDPYKNMHEFYESIVKFPSMVSCFTNNFPGKKVFLYRPLAQHLLKMKSIESSWHDGRESKIDYIFNNYKHLKLSDFTIQNNMDKIVFLWLCSVFRMQDQEDVLWINTNNFLNDKKKTIQLVCKHFGIPEPNDYNICKINVKKSNINVGDLPINGNIEKMQNIECVYASYGIIETNLALVDKEIKSLVEKIENKYKEIRNYIY